MHRESRLHASNGKAGKNNPAVLPTRLEPLTASVFVVVAIYSCLLSKLTERYRAFSAERIYTVHPPTLSFIRHRNYWEHFVDCWA